MALEAAVKKEIQMSKDLIADRLCWLEEQNNKSDDKVDHKEVEISKALIADRLGWLEQQEGQQNQADKEEAQLLNKLIIDNQLENSQPCETTHVCVVQEDVAQQTDDMVTN